jgi:hypothetical protein
LAGNSIPVRNGDFLTQSLRKLVTLNKCMPKEMRMMENIIKMLRDIYSMLYK